VLEPAHGVMLTSATLTDRTTDSMGDNDRWASAIARSGAAHVEVQPLLSAATSPFDYAARAEVLIVTDIAKGDLPALAGAYARIIEASHFRDDPHASLIGTDALRDGVDVPGHSLRCVVMEQVPWPRPDILHKARRLAGGGSAYDDRIIRARLAQAFGRLIRSKEDAGHFVMLSPAFPTRLQSAFPPGTPVLRVTLDQALQRITAGVGNNPAMPSPASAKGALLP
jgi:ATP-dependent DNA helicase DinG